MMNQVRPLAVKSNQAFAQIPCHHHDRAHADVQSGAVDSCQSARL